MRYRALSATGDYTFGRSATEFLVNTPETVAQAVATRLRLYKGEWFLDVDDGTPWNTEVLGKSERAVRDAAIRSRILGTQGVTQLLAFASQDDANARLYSAQATVETVYGLFGVTIKAVDDGFDRLDLDFIFDRSLMV